MAVPLRVPKITDESRYGKLDRISQVSEKVLKGRAISNSVECVRSMAGKSALSDQNHSFVTGPKMSAPTNRHKFTPISGSDGKPICIQILYRSRGELARLTSPIETKQYHSNSSDAWLHSTVSVP